MWHLFSRIGEQHTVHLHPEWRGVRDKLLHERLPKCGTSVRHTMTVLLADATPEKPWACAAEGYLFKIRRIRTHDPVNGAEDVASEDPDHGSREHAELGASSCYRWWNCPGSLNLARHLKATTGLTETTSAYAKEGTVAHELAHACLIKGQDAIEYIDRQIDGHTINDEMASAVQVYLDVCRSYVRDGVECLTEKRFNLKALGTPVGPVYDEQGNVIATRAVPMFGTGDFVVLDRAAKKLVVIDLKYGKGISVEAIGNPQLKYYMLGVMCAFQDVSISSIEGIIVQPRTSTTPKRVTYKVSELFDWSVELMQHAAATIQPDAPRAAGSWCRFCPCAGSCPTQAEAAFDAAQVEFQADTPMPAEAVLQGEVIPPIRTPELRLLTPQQLGQIKKQFGVLKQFMEAVDDALAAYVHQGIEDTGWKLEAGEGNRKYLDEEEAARALVKHGLAPSEVHEINIISPAQAERKLIAKLREVGIKAKDAKPLVQAELAKITTRPATAPRLVPASHPGPGLPAPGSEFSYEPEPVTT